MDLLRRAFADPIANALNCEGHCRLPLAATPLRIVVAVGDNNPGIPPEDRVRLLEPFQRGAPARAGCG